MHGDSSRSFLNRMRMGKRYLVHHRPDRALMMFKEALESTDAGASGEFVFALYWLAVAFFRLGKTELAIRTLSSAQKVRRRGRARDLYLAWVNGYGMLRRANSGLDDMYAFSSLQIGAYLSRKKNRRFDSGEEKDLVLRTVMDAWKSMCSAGVLDGKSCSEKLVLFRTRRPRFPFYMGSGGRVSGGASILAAVPERFRDACRDGDERCGCGSGLPYCMCCGRIPGLREYTGG